ncbi:MAG: polymer-forming cytoskeletal protein [Anaerolineae bacterium]|nr:polymer-forming cytoskeletal protein [Anaerolineae bacterium]
MKRALLATFFIVLVALALPGSVLAADLQQGKVVFGDNYILRGGETLHGDLTLFGGNAELEPGSLVDGNVLMFGGNLIVNGDVSGDVTALGGNLSLGSSAVVRGTVQSFGGNLEHSPGARTEGGVRERDGLEFPFRWEPPFGDPFRFWSAPRSTLASLVQSWVWFLFRTILLAVLAAVVVMIWPKQAARVAQTVVEEPLTTGAVGLVALIIIPILLVALAITICLIPISVIGGILLAVAAAFGRIALGLEVGNRLGHTLKQEWQPPADAFIGTFVLFFVVDGIGLIPCIGWIAPLAVGALGLGGVILTRFGTRAYVGTRSAATPPAPPVPVVPPEPLAKD